MACAALAYGLLAKRGDKAKLGDSQVRTRPRFSNAGSTHVIFVSSVEVGRLWQKNPPKRPDPAP